MGEEEKDALMIGFGGGKRKKLGEEGVPAAANDEPEVPGNGSASTCQERRLKALEAQMKVMSFTVGDGDHAANVQIALLRDRVTLERRVSQLEHATYVSYESTTTENNMIEQVKEAMDDYNVLCQEAKGTGKVIGSGHLWAFKGICNWLVTNNNLAVEDRRWLQAEVLTKAGDGMGNIDDDKLTELDLMCKVCNLKVTKKKMFFNIKLTEDFNVRLGQMIHTAIKKIPGTNVQAGPAPPPPNVRAMKDTLVAKGQWGQGKGKGAKGGA